MNADLAEALNRLTRPHNDGLLTDEEYEAKRRSHQP
jgi:hypothetical protein